MVAADSKSKARATHGTIADEARNTGSRNTVQKASSPQAEASSRILGGPATKLHVLPRMRLPAPLPSSVNGMRFFNERWILGSANRRSLILKTAMALSAIVWTMPAIPLRADPADFTVFTNKQSYSGVLLQQGRVQTDADWNEQTTGAIHQGQIFEIFSFMFDPANVQPAVGSGIVSGLAVGAAPDGSFHGDQGISLVVQPGLALDAFGREIAYGPFEGSAHADIFRLIVQCPNPPCVFSDSQSELDPHGGVLFLGVIAQPGFDFSQVTIEAVTPRDDSGEPIGTVPNWQLDAISFSAIPEPSGAVLLATVFCVLAAVRCRMLPRVNG